MSVAESSKQLQYNRRKSEHNRDIGSPPPIVNQDRRDAATKSFKLYLETYHAKDVYLGWSESHLILLDAIQRAVLEGWKQAIVFPRGSGKTTICQRALLWATLCAHRKFAAIFAAEASKSKQHIKAIRLELMENNLLFEDFPEVCYAFRRTGNIPTRAAYQQSNGELTNIAMQADHLVFPNMESSRSRGNADAVVCASTVTGAGTRGLIIRGRRPDVALIDDPQTDKSAKSPPMIQERTQCITSGIGGMAGPDTDISILYTGTVIQNDDMTSKFVDRKLKPEFRGIKVKMLASMPKNIGKWDEWSEIVRNCHENDLSLSDAHEFYTANRKDMDEGAEHYWPNRIRPGFVSAIETGMYLYYTEPAAFASEYQNEPLQFEFDEGMPSVEQLRKQTNGRHRRVVPRDVEKITAFIDVQKKMLFYMVIGWQKDFSGHVLEYGTWPDQKRNYFTKLDARVTIGHKLPGSSWDNCLDNALKRLVMEELSRPYHREDGVEMKIERGLIDAQWGDSTSTVYSFLADNKLAPVWMPSHGMAVRASQKALNDVKSSKKDRAKVGVHWRISKHEQYRIERITFDANFWKSFNCQRWSTIVGDPGCMMFYGRRDHLLVSEHLNAEYGVLVESSGRRVTEWHAKPGSDNDWLDCSVGNCIAASMLGIKTQQIKAMIPKAASELPAITSDNVEAFYG